MAVDIAVSREGDRSERPGMEAGPIAPHPCTVELAAGCIAEGGRERRRSRRLSGGMLNAARAVSEGGPLRRRP